MDTQTQQKEKVMTLTQARRERQGIADAFIQKVEAEAIKHQEGKDYDAKWSYKAGMLKAVIEGVVCSSPEAAEYIKRLFL